MSIVLEIILVNTLVPITRCTHAANISSSEFIYREPHEYDTILHAVGLVDRYFAEMVPKMITNGCASTQMHQEKGLYIWYRDDPHGYLHGPVTYMIDIARGVTKHSYEEHRYNRYIGNASICMHDNNTAVMHTTWLFNRVKYYSNVRVALSRPCVRNHISVQARCIHCHNCILSAICAVFAEIGTLHIDVYHNEDFRHQIEPIGETSIGDYSYILSRDSIELFAYGLFGEPAEIDPEQTNTDVGIINHIVGMFKRAEGTPCRYAQAMQYIDYQDAYARVLAWITRNEVVCEHKHNAIAWYDVSRYYEDLHPYNQLLVASVVNKRFALEVPAGIAKLRCPITEIAVNTPTGIDYMYGGLLPAYMHGNYVYTHVSDEISMRWLVCAYGKVINRFAITQVRGLIHLHGEYIPGRVIRSNGVVVLPICGFDMMLPRDHPALAASGTHAHILDPGMHCVDCIKSVFARVIASQKYLTAVVLERRPPIVRGDIDLALGDTTRYQYADNMITLHDYDLFGTHTARTPTSPHERNVAKVVRGMFDRLLHAEYSDECAVRGEHDHTE